MVNVDTVYKTCLLILNKQQRGYLNPIEFNKLGEQVQLEIFEKYFEDLNQQLRIPGNESEYADRVKTLEEKIDIFKSEPAATTYDGVGGYFYGTTSIAASDYHRLGSVIYKDIKEVDPIQRKQFLLVNKSPLTKPTTTYPLYINEGEHQSAAGPPPVLHPKFFVYPTSITNSGDITFTYIKKPKSPYWAFTQDATTGAYIFAPTGAARQDFELHPSEQNEIILRILVYAGVIIRDPQIVQAASQKVQLDNMNEKS